MAVGRKFLGDTPVLGALLAIVGCQRVNTGGERHRAADGRFVPIHHLGNHALVIPALAWMAIW